MGSGKTDKRGACSYKFHFLLQLPLSLKKIPKIKPLTSRPAPLSLLRLCVSVTLQRSKQRK